jgi:hypothetical protein
MTLVDAWLEDLRREEEEIAAIVPERSTAGQSTPLSEVAERLGINLDGLWPCRRAVRARPWQQLQSDPVDTMERSGRYLGAALRKCAVRGYFRREAV